EALLHVRRVKGPPTAEEVDEWLATVREQAGEAIGEEKASTTRRVNLRPLGRASELTTGIPDALDWELMGSGARAEQSVPASEPRSVGMGRRLWTAANVGLAIAAAVVVGVFI